MANGEQPPIPFVSSTPAVEGSEGQLPANNPILSSLAAAMQNAQAQVQAAQKQVQSTPMYASGAAGQPTMPVPSLKSGLFAGASPQNLAGYQPQTAKGVRAKGIGQIAGTAAGFVGKFMQKKEAEKTQALAQDIQRTLELTKAIDENKAALSANPNDPSLKVQLQKNMASLNQLMQDPKKAKQIAKAFDVTFGEEAKDKANTPEAQAMQQAMKAQQFLDKLPQTTVANPAYEAAQKNLLAVQKQADDLTKAMGTFGASVIRTQAMDRATQQRAQTGAEHSQTMRDIAREHDDTRKRIAAAQIVGRSDVEAQRHLDKMAEIQATIAGHLKAIDKAQQSPAAKMKMAQDVFNQYNGTIKNIDNEIEKRQKQLNDPKTEDADKKNIQQEIKDLQGEKLPYLEGAERAKMMMFGDPDGATMEGIVSGGYEPIPYGGGGPSDDSGDDDDDNN